MNVTFLIPPVLDNTKDVDRCFGCNYAIYFLPLLPILYIATILKDEIETIAIHDFAANRKNRDDLIEFIKDDDSDLYIFYSVFLSQKTDIISRNIIRENRKNVRFVITGPQASFAPELFLDKEDTFAVRGEPELTVKKLVRAMKSDSDFTTLKGISYRKSSEIFHTPPSDIIENIDDIPIPDRTLLDHRPYFNPKLHYGPHTAALSSRGCYARCWYCVPNSLSYAREIEYKKCYGKKPPPRLHSVERVIEEVSNIAELGFRSVSFIDDEFLWNDERTIKICEGIEDYGLEWSCLARPDKVTERSARAMAKAGCAYVDLGTESFDEDILKAIRKDMSPNDTQRAVKILRTYGIKPELNVLLGATPKETEETIKRTLKMVKDLNPEYVLFSIANPFPGTDFYDSAKKHGWLVYGKYRPVDPAKEAIISYPHLSKEKLEWYVSHAYLTYYFRPRYLLRELFRLRSYSDFKHKFSIAVQLIRRSLGRYFSRRDKTYQ